MTIPLPCSLLDPAMVRIAGSERDYRRCKHPAKPHGELVCTCIANACGPSCSGYSVPINAGVVIGCYSEPGHDMRGIIELQIRAIRANCGPVPILLTVDQCEHSGHLEALTDRYDAVDYRDVAPERIGHAGGDLGAFHHGLQWAHGLGLKFLAKLSQRYLIDLPKWVQRSAAKDEQTLCNRCLEGKFKLPMRTEGVFMRVADWLPAVPHLAPRRVFPASGEHAVWSVMNAVGLRRVHAWEYLSGPDRCRPKAGVVWKCSNTLGDYEALASKYGVRLGDTWRFHGWPKDQITDWG